MSVWPETWEKVGISALAAYLHSFYTGIENLCTVLLSAQDILSKAGRSIYTSDSLAKTYPNGIAIRSPMM